MNYVRYFVIGLLSIWLLGFLIIFASNGHGRGDRSDDASSMAGGEFKKRFLEAEKKLAQLEQRNKQYEQLIRELEQKASGVIDSVRSGGKISDRIRADSSKEPTKDGEGLRRKIYEDIKDISYYFEAHVDNPGVDKKVLKKNFKHRINLLLAQMYNYSVIEGRGEWRQHQADNLMEIVQAKFERQQNPSDCAAVKQILCDLGKGCGFGCQMHHAMYCFITAYFTNRTFILDSENWRYHPGGYEAYFKPLSSCKKVNEQATPWGNADLATSKVIKMPIIDNLSNRPSFLPLAVPKEYLSTLERMHGDPFVWWAGQVLRYLMRFNSDMESTIADVKQKLGFQTPCVGVHVRRTDKVGTEAAFHGLEEYMKEVDFYYDTYEIINDGKLPDDYKRAVYLASDEPDVLKEAPKKYPNYKFIFDEGNAKSAGLNSRYSPESAQGVILDIYFLSQTDFLVCTFSSQVCRLAYELMQSRFPDASWRFRSLDDVYYFGGQLGHTVRAVYDHQADPSRGEIELKVGDEIGLAGNHWNGFSKGRNHRTRQEGLFPSYKVLNIVYTNN